MRRRDFIFQFDKIFQNRRQLILTLNAFVEA